jgi:hypothetical protein
MPLLAAFIGTLASGLVAVFSRFMVMRYALNLASYTAWIVVFGVFVSTVFACVTGLSNMLQAMFNSGTSNAVVKGFGMGLGMFIPSNATAVMSCLASVWIACQIYKVQKQGMHHYSK